MTSGKSTFQRNLIPSILLVWFLELNVAGATPFSRWEFKEPHMGTLFRIILFAENFKAASNAAQKAFKRIQEIESSLTDYQDNSELNQLCSNAYESPQVVSQDLFDVLQESHHLSEVSGGAFDVTIKPLINYFFFNPISIYLLNLHIKYETNRCGLMIKYFLCLNKYGIK